MTSAEKPLLVILGPTASGKTRLAAHVATQLNGAIISADSRQIYRGMDIGTGKDLHEYMVNGQQIPYHLIDIRDAGDKYHVHDFQHDFEAACRTIVSTGHQPIVCGGSGFYMYATLTGQAYTQIPVDEALRAELDDESTESLLARFEKLDSPYKTLADTSTRKRLVRAIEISLFLIRNPEAVHRLMHPKAPYRFKAFGLNPETETRRRRITARLKQRLDEGLIEEVQSLLNSGLAPEQLIYYGLEYKYITQYLTGERLLDQMLRTLETEIHRFAKRQMTFFRKMEKDGIAIDWVPDSLGFDDKVRWITDRF